jgi:protein CpxP
MKTRLKLISLCLALAGIAGPVLNAQPADPASPARERGPGGPGGPGRGGPNLETLAEELGLSAEQKAKLEPILKAQREQQQAIRQDESLSREQRMEKTRALREAGRKDIEAVLTPEQVKKYGEMRARGPRGGGDGPGRDGKGEKGPKPEKPAGN